jgi:hypothetical protein
MATTYCSIESSVISRQHVYAFVEHELKITSEALKIPNLDLRDMHAQVSTLLVCLRFTKQQLRHGRCLAAANRCLFGVPPIHTVER